MFRFFFLFSRTACSVHLTYVASGPKHTNSGVKYRLLESRIPQLFLIPSRHPTPTSTFIPIPSAKAHVAPAHCIISSNELCTYTWRCIAVTDLLSKTKTNIYFSRCKRVQSYILKFCDSLIISHVARIAPLTWSLFRCHPCIFIPLPAFIMSL